MLVKLLAIRNTHIQDFSKFESETLMLVYAVQHLKTYGHRFEVYGNTERNRCSM